MQRPRESVPYAKMGHVVSKAKNLNDNIGKRWAELIQPPLMGRRSKWRGFP